MMSTESECVLTTSDVAVKTLSVEIKVMKLGNRQVTLAVFRQLPNEPIIDPDTGQIRGIPWGRVNYHVDCEEGKEHVHVVWQKGNQLRRALVTSYSSSPTWDKLATHTDNYAEGYIGACILEGWMPEKYRETHQEYSSGIYGLPSRFTVQLDDDKVTFHTDDVLKYCWSKSYEGEWKIYHQKEIHAILNRLQLPADSMSIRRDFLLPALQAQRAFERRWQQSYTQLKALDQLFIAV